MLRCETNTPQMGRKVEKAWLRWADTNWTPPEGDRLDHISADFEHGQWFVTHLPTGAQWSANDLNDDDFDFEQVSVGDSE